VTLTIRCDHFTGAYRCPAELSGLAFNAKPVRWEVHDLGSGDHLDYCPEHVHARFYESQG
jgi:hypothetical protein